MGNGYASRTTNGFQLKYTREDKLLLAALDVRHNTLSGPATKKLCERAYQLFGETELLLDQAFYLSQRISRHLPNITGYQSFVCFTQRHIAKLH
jgi:hypothetical protein